jgi:hypothetical protein
MDYGLSRQRVGQLPDLPRVTRAPETAVREAERTTCLRTNFLNMARDKGARDSKKTSRGY